MEAQAGVQPHRCDRRGLESSLLACCRLLHWPKVLPSAGPPTAGDSGELRPSVWFLGALEPLVLEGATEPQVSWGWAVSSPTPQGNCKHQPPCLGCTWSGF